MTYTDGNIVQQLTERQQGKEYVDALLDEAYSRLLPIPRQDGKARMTARRFFRRKYGPVWGDIIWREFYFGKWDD